MWLKAGEAQESPRPIYDTVTGEPERQLNVNLGYDIIEQMTVDRVGMSYENVVAYLEVKKFPESKNT